VVYIVTTLFCDARARQYRVKKAVCGVMSGWR